MRRQKPSSKVVKDVPKTQKMRNAAKSSSGVSSIKKSQNLLTVAKSTLEEKRVSFAVHENLKSFKNKKIKFTNFVANKEKVDSEIEMLLHKISSLLDRDCMQSELPFNLDMDQLRIEPRQKQIISSSGINNIDWSSLYKVRCLDSISKRDSNMRRECPVRLFIGKEEGEITKYTLILIDLYHLFATKNKSEINANYNKARAFETCITNYLLL